MTTPDWLQEEGLRQWLEAVRSAGGEARVVGGAVRDHLLGREGLDVDLATTLLPGQVMALAEQQGVKAIPTGLAHGTITLVLPERVVEVTTLRRDVATDGRHAQVAFTDDWQVDAARRDFTINALYMDADGTVYDYFGGREDLAAQRIRFIGDAAQRITEDALRILRFFRFLASHGKPPADAAALQAIAQQVSRMERLSGERIAAEMRKLLGVANPAFALRLMHEQGVTPQVFPRTIMPPRLIRLHMLESQADYQCSVWARIAALLELTPHDVGWLAERWKLARHEMQQLQLLATLPVYSDQMPRHAHTRLLRMHGAPAYLDWLLLRATVQQGVEIAPWVALAQTFVAPSFPVAAADLLARGMQEGKALGETLTRLETVWEHSDYRLGKDELLAQL